jgi:hypothetical protein
MPHTETMTVKAGEVGVSLWRTNHRALMESLERKIVTGSKINVLILTDQNSWGVCWALGKPEKLAQAITNHDNERIPAGQKVLRVYQYEVLKEARDPLKHTYCLPHK